MRHLIPLFLGLRAAAAPFVIEVAVRDESGVALAGASVHADTVPAPSMDPWNMPSRRVRVEAVADADGLARLGLDHALSELLVVAVAPGFHAAACRIPRGAPRAQVILPRRLGAAGSTRVSLVTGALPDDGAEHGFDLAMGAFTPPLGVGRRADVRLRGRCASARLPRDASGAYADTALMCFTQAGDGVLAVPRPGQVGFAASVAPACDGMLLPGLAAPRQAPVAGYVDQLAYRSARGPAPSDIPGPGRLGAPQWIFRVTRESGALHGVITDFGWVEGGRLRIDYRISTEPGNRSLEFGP